MKFSVTRISRGLVAPSGPSGPTPSGVLELSAIDRLPVLRGNVQTLHVYKHGLGAAKVIREALSKALISYYPLAGRLRCSDQNDELQVDCSGDGVWFVEALSDCTLDAVSYFDDAMLIPYDELLPVPPPEIDGLDPLVQMQVTQFGCNGFVVGLTFCHSICDGLGAAQFLNAVGELGRGAKQPSITPEWCRSFIPPRPALPPRPIHIPEDYQLEQATIDLSLDKIKELKQEFRKRSHGGKTCSTFEMVAAVLWRERTRAIAPPQDDDLVKLVFFANCRQLVPLPKGFYGNCFFPVSVTVPSGTLTKEEGMGLSNGVFQAVKLIQEAKAGVGNEFRKWAMMDDDHDSDPFAPGLEYGTLFMSEWDRLGFKEVDYGYGKPVHIVAIQGSSSMPIGIVCSPPAPATGVRLMTWCLQQPHIPHLLRNMHESSLI